jgi:hypothetical protein
MAFHAFHTLSFPWPSSGVAGNSILAIIVAPASDPAHETERGYLSFKDGELNMGYVPKDAAEWYLAEIVQELTVADDPRNMVWRNLTLVRANSPDEAYERALSLGRAGDTEYLNPGGKLVTTRFRGISFMDVIHDTLEDGAELIFYSEVDVAQEQLRKLLRSKEELNLFRPNRSLAGPDVASGEIVEEVEKRFGVSRPDRP